MRSTEEIKAELQDLKIFSENQDNEQTVGPEHSEVLVKIKALEWVLGLKDKI